MARLHLNSAGWAVLMLGIGFVSGCSSTTTLTHPEFTFRRSSAAATADTSIASATATAPAPAAPAGSIATTAPSPVVAPPNTTEPPAVSGSRLHAIEAETATQRALELTRKLSDAEAERTRLVARIERLESTNSAKDKDLELARTEIQSARAELARARDELERWKQEIASLRDKLRGADEENLHTLQTAVALLQQILSQADDRDSEGSSGRTE